MINTIKNIIEKENPYIIACTLAYNFSDLSFIDEKFKPKRNHLDGTYVLDIKNEENLRSFLKSKIEKYDFKNNHKKVLNNNFIKKNIKWMLSESYNENLFKLYLQELGLNQDIKFNKDTISNKNFHVVIIGAGISGLGLAIRLKRSGVSFTIIEKNYDLGGTWFENSYPGARVDVASSLYSYSFAQNPNWKHIYATQNELFEYLNDLSNKENIKNDIRFNSKVISADFNDISNTWSLNIKTSGCYETLNANVLICATGQLNKKKYPKINGIKNFRGTILHSSDWRKIESDAINSKRVGIIGSASTAVQLTPGIIDFVGELHLFQRSPNWFHNVPHYRKETPPSISNAFREIPNFLNWFRLWYFIPSIEGMLSSVSVDHNWDISKNSCSEKNHELMVKMKSYIQNEFEDRPDLLKLSIPNYPPGSKRPVLDDGSWAKALKNSKTKLHTKPINQIDNNGIVLSNNSKINLDTIIFATGFSASDFLSDIVITRNGNDLQSQWNGSPKAYLGLCIENFPNLFMMYGPNTNGVVNSNIIFFSECQMNFIIDAINIILNNHSRLLVRKDALENFIKFIDDKNSKMAWGITSENSWYKDSNGRISQNWPFSCSLYWQMTKKVDLSKFEE